MSLLCGVDIGGAKLAVGLMAPDGRPFRVETTGERVSRDGSGFVGAAALPKCAA